MAIIKLKRGETSAIESYTPQAGEPVWDKNRNILKLGDGNNSWSELEQLKAIPEDWINVKDFGAKGNNSNDDTSAIQSAIDFAETIQGFVYLPAGTYKITSPLHMKRGVSLFGAFDGRKFRTTIVPENCGAFVIDGGDYADWNYRIGLSNFLIYGDHYTDSSAAVIKVNKAYQINIENVYLHNNYYPYGIYIDYSNQVVLKDISLFNYSAGVNIGIYVSDSTVEIYNPDIEVWHEGMRFLSTSRNTIANIYGLYAERNILTTYIHYTLSGIVNFYGGYISNPSSSATAIKAYSSVNVFGTKLDLSGGHGIYTWNTYTTPNSNIIGVPLSQIEDNRGDFCIVNGNEIILPNLPTYNPNKKGRLWVDSSSGYVIKVSQG